MPINWKGDAVESALVKALRIAMRDIGLDIEGEAKKELRKGHGVITGTLRRSIHSAGPDYDWSGDNAFPSESTPERGGQAPDAERIGDRLVITVGSGLEYAFWVHQGTGSFEGYHFITNAVEKVRPRVPEHVRRNTNG